MKPYLEDSPFLLPALAPGRQLLSCKDNGWAEEQTDSPQPDTGGRNHCFISFSTWLGLEKERRGLWLSQVQGDPARTPGKTRTARDSGRNSFLGFARQQTEGGDLGHSKLQIHFRGPSLSLPKSTLVRHPPPPIAVARGGVPLKKVAVSQGLEAAGPY